MGYRIRMICPYFGKLISTSFILWLNSCEKNYFIDFLIFTDDKEALSLPHPDNVLFHYMTWDECKQRIKEKMPVPVNLKYAYKLCDLKPCYGLLFEEYLTDCDFWGHCDISDSIFGDLSAFITDEILKAYDKIGIYGHFSLYRNSTENNIRFMIPSKRGMSISKIFSREEVTGFDEMWHPHSINTIFQENGFPVYSFPNHAIADILPRFFRFCLWGKKNDSGQYPPRIFEWNNGKILSHFIMDGKIISEEYAYLHFQKRSMKGTCRNENDYYIVPNYFLSIDHPLSAEDILNYSKDRICVDYYRGRVKRAWWYIQHPAALFRKVLRVLKIQW